MRSKKCIILIPQLADRGVRRTLPRRPSKTGVEIASLVPIASTHTHTHTHQRKREREYENHTSSNASLEYAIHSTESTLLYKTHNITIESTSTLYMYVHIIYVQLLFKALNINT